MKIRYLPHTADIRMKIEGETLENLFMAGIKGMGNILKEGCCNASFKFEYSITIEARSLDHTGLLIDFLSDILSLSYTEKSVYCSIRILELSDDFIAAEVFGTPVDCFDEEIKAVTYHEADVKKNSNGQWETCIIFDI